MINFPIKHARLGILTLAVMLVALMFLGVVQGAAPIGLNEVSLLIKQSLLDVSESLVPDWVLNIVWHVRTPRMVIAVLVGATLAICGAAMQGLLRNPLASPSVLGVTSGASLGAVFVMYLGLASVSVWLLPLFAFVGAGLTIALVYTIASQRGHTSIGTLILAGVAVGALNVALSSLLLAMALNNWEIGRSIIYWTMGGLEGRTWDHVLLIAPPFIIGAGLLMTYARDLDAMLLGEIHATSVGVDVASIRKKILLITSMMVGAAVAVSGSIGFIGLVVPHILRLVFGPHHRYLLPASLLAGGICLLGADILMQIYFPTKDVPVGVVTASMGAPFFLYLLIRQRKSLQVNL